MKKIYFFVWLWVALFSAKAQNVATFENVQLGKDSWWNGFDGTGAVLSGSFKFPNLYNPDWGSWSGFSVSNMKDSTTSGWENQYSAITACGAHQSENYSVVYVSDELKMEFDDPVQLRGFYVTNATYTYLSMKNGDDFSKKFGGVNGTDPDYLKLIISGTDIYGKETDPVEFFLADFTFNDNSNDYLIKSWKWVDLTNFGFITNLKFRLKSTDIGAWGMNTPAYFCIDDFNGISPETPKTVAEADMEDLQLPPKSFYNGSDGAGGFSSGGFAFKNSYNSDWASWSGFAASNITDNQTKGWSNQYSAIPGGGANQYGSFAVSYVTGHSELEFSESTLSGFYITNATYTYWSMREGDDFSKKFGGIDGKDPDWFKVTIVGITEKGDTAGTLDYYLADFRVENNAEDFIVDSWKWVDLTPLGNISKLRFTLSSSDVGTWGMNTPAYFCIDQINHQDFAPYIKNPVGIISEKINLKDILYLPLDSVFSDPDNPDSEITLKLEYIDNSELLNGMIVSGGNPEQTLLAINIAPEKTGEAIVIISATSNGKKVYHSFRVIVTVPVLAESMHAGEFNVYPNPVKSSFFVELPLGSENVVLYNPSGIVILHQIISGENKIRIDHLENSPSGIYFLKVKSGKDIFTCKVVKI